MTKWKKLAKATSIGTVFGALITLVLFLGQNVEFFFYLLGAPYYLDAVTIRFGTLVGPITFIYYTIICSIVAYLLIAQSGRFLIIASAASLLALHVVLLYLAADLLAEAFGKGLRIWLQRGA